MILSLVLIPLALVYAALVTWFFVGWKRLSVPATAASAPYGPGPRLSVVVAARNEAGRAGPLLEALIRQDARDFEVILVDDHSEDGTLEAFRRHTGYNGLAVSPPGPPHGHSRPVLRLLSSREHGMPQGKKHALKLGVSQSSAPWILTTDADCLPRPGWARAMARALSEPGTAMVLGPVRLHGKGLFGAMQELEFYSLVGSTGGAAALGHPIMANGASLGFRKEAFLQAGGYASGQAYPSGDDIFLMHAIHHQGRGHIRFLKDPQAIVETGAATGLAAFFRQRGRWAGKAGGYRDRFTLFVASVVGMFNLVLLAAGLWLVAHCVHSGGESLTGFPSGFGSLWILLTAIMLKAAADLLLLQEVTGFFGRRRLLWLFPLVFVVYPPYVLTSLIVGWFRGSRW
jgi:cellulose synthase/poly-beta-1,6-N-acetylglucosamine synthase-like glycosyltransferase